MTREEAIRAALAPLGDSTITVRNDSRQHRGHGGDDGSGESHFHVTVVSNAFDGQGRLARQRAVMDLLKPLFDAGLHSVALSVLTPAEAALQSTSGSGDSTSPGH